MKTIWNRTKRRWYAGWSSRTNEPIWTENHDRAVRLDPDLAAIAIRQAEMLGLLDVLEVCPRD